MRKLIIVTAMLLAGCAQQHDPVSDYMQDLELHYSWCSPEPSQQMKIDFAKEYGTPLSYDIKAGLYVWDGFKLNAEYIITQFDQNNRVIQASCVGIK